MKKSIFFLLPMLPLFALSQSMGIGVKAGLNFANVTKVSEINNSSNTGFNLGLYMAPPSKGIFSSRTELLFSRQGYNYKTNTNTGVVDLNYIMLPQYMCINITKFFQLQFGGQIGVLLNSKVDSSKTSTTTGSASYDQMMSYYNRFDYGYGGGIEIHPISGLVLGARLNISLGDLYKTPEPGEMPSFIPKVDVKNNVFAAYLGWTFGKQPKKAKKDKKDKNDKSNETTY